MEFEVVIEYVDGEVVDMFVSKSFWFERLYDQLENDDTVLHYTVDTIEDLV